MTFTINPRTLDPRKLPPEWDDPIERDLYERLRPDEYGLRNKQQQKIIDRIRASRWLLLRNEMKARCRNCDQVHEYITYGCIERPFNGLDEIYRFEEHQARERGAIGGQNLIVTEGQYKSMRLGAPVPITRKEAQRLKLRIRAKLGRGAI